MRPISNVLEVSICWPIYSVLSIVSGRILSNHSRHSIPPTSGVLAVENCSTVVLNARFW